MKTPVKLILVVFLIFSFLGILSCENKLNGESSDSIKIASFNIQIFGQTKASNQEVMDILAQIIREFDIVAIQEIRVSERLSATLLPAPACSEACASVKGSTS